MKCESAGVGAAGARDDVNFELLGAPRAKYPGDDQDRDDAGLLALALVVPADSDIYY